MGPRCGEGLAPRARKRKVSSFLENGWTRTRAEQVCENQEFSLGYRKAKNLIQLVGFMSLELREEAKVGDKTGMASASVWFKAMDG